MRTHQTGPGRAYHYLEGSVWVTPPADICPALSGQSRADVVIVGGGYTGLNAALCLKQQGVDVLLLEAEFCGAGASGRNSGHLAPTMGKDLPSLVRQVGRERARELLSFNDRALRYTENIIKTHASDCEYQAVGNITCGLHPRHAESLRKSARLAEQLGVEVSRLSEQQMRARGLPEAFRFGVLDPRGGHLNPGKYVMSLRRAALACGVRIFENSPVTGIRASGSPVVVKTAQGEVRADKLIVATNAYTPQLLPELKHRIMPIRVTLFRTGRLSDKQREAIKWPREEGLITAHAAMEHYRLTSDGRIVGGSKFVHYGYGSTLAKGYRPSVFSAFEDLIKTRFPELPELRIESFWGGWIGMTADFLPLSFANRDGTVFYGMGYNGHGIAHATANGKMLADQVLGIPNPDVELFQRRQLPLPPEPLRWLAVNALKSHYARIDRRVDEVLRRDHVQA